MTTEASVRKLKNPKVISGSNCKVPAEKVSWTRDKWKMH